MPWAGTDDGDRVVAKPKARFTELAHLPFIESAENVVMLGPSGVGKTLALILCHRAVMAGHKARFITAANLMMKLAAAKAQGRLKEYFNRAILGLKLLVVDEIGQQSRQESATRIRLRQVNGRQATPTFSYRLREQVG